MKLHMRLVAIIAATLLLIIPLFLSSSAVLVEAQKFRSLFGNIPKATYQYGACSKILSSATRNSSCTFTVRFESALQMIGDMSQLEAHSDMCTQKAWNQCNDTTYVTGAECSAPLAQCTYRVTMVRPAKPYKLHAVYLVRKEQRVNFRVTAPQYILGNATVTTYGSAGQVSSFLCVVMFAVVLLLV